MNTIKIYSPLYDSENEIISFDFNDEFKTNKTFKDVIEDLRQNKKYKDCEIKTQEGINLEMARFKSSKTGLTRYKLIYSYEQATKED